MLKGFPLSLSCVEECLRAAITYQFFELVVNRIIMKLLKAIA